jgi:hypothetical protein
LLKKEKIMNTKNPNDKTAVADKAKELTNQIDQQGAQANTKGANWPQKAQDQSGSIASEAEDRVKEGVYHAGPKAKDIWQKPGETAKDPTTKAEDTGQDLATKAGNKPKQEAKPADKRRGPAGPSSPRPEYPQ